MLVRERDGVLYKFLGDVPVALLGRDQAEIRHQLARVLEAREVADLCNNGDCHDQADAAHGLHGFHDGPHRPRGKQALDLRGQAFDARFGVLDRVDVILQDNLLGGMIEPNAGSQRR